MKWGETGQKFDMNVAPKIHLDWVKPLRLIRAAAFLLCTAVAAPAIAQDFDKGLAAARVGDYETALLEWRPLAAQGDADAQYNLGVMYDNGQGVIQDYAEAVNWYRLAAKQGFGHAPQEQTARQGFEERCRDEGCGQTGNRPLAQQSSREFTSTI